MPYHCAECKLAVIVFGEKLIKGCRCDAAVVAEASAGLVGQGGVSG
jgi:hypothetical protein